MGKPVRGFFVWWENCKHLVYVWRFAMLKDLQNAQDIHRNDVFRKSFNSTVANFKPDTRVRSKSFKHQHYLVEELHGDRYLACVTHESGAVLVETDAKASKKSMIAISCIDMSIYAEALAEGREQIRRHVKAKKGKAA